MTVVRHIAVVSESKRVKLTDLVAPAAALQIQVIRDFAPAWRRHATVAAFATLNDVPLDHWPVIVRDDIPYQAQGIHLDKDGSPFSLVLYSSGWSLTTSHETLEMLGDPMGKRTHKAPSIKPGQGQVKYLVEVCDPSEADAYAYSINGVTVSDFYLPSFFDTRKKAGKRYSFTGAIPTPRTVLPGGYLTWQDPATNKWWQQTYFGSKEFKDLGVFARGANPRRASDGDTDVPETAMRSHGVREERTASGERAQMLEGQPHETSASRAKYLRDQVRQIVAAAS